MNLLGKWYVIAMADRELVFCDDGTGYFSIEGEPIPLFKWWLNESGRLGWQFFLEPDMTRPVSRAHEPEYEVLCDGMELRFKHAPFPFGIKHFSRSVDAQHASKVPGGSQAPPL